MSFNILDFERPIAELDANISELKDISVKEGIDRSVEINELEMHRDRLIKEIFSKLTPWDKTLTARHPNRPYMMDYIRLIFDDFIELHGDRLFADDKALIGGFASLDKDVYLIIGHQKGRDLKDRQYRNFGSAKPEGYRKAGRLMKMAEKFNRPIICFIDTPAADCSIGAEERGISEAIAHNMYLMSTLKVPVICIIIGEGGSGGAIGIGVGNKVLMLEHSIYSVIPPEGCAAIIWRDATKGSDAAEALKLTAQSALQYEVIDEIIPEPLGAAHRDYDEMAKNIKSAIFRNLDTLSSLTPDELADQRYQKFRQMGVFGIEPAVIFEN